MTTYIIYTKTNCPSCVRAKNWLNKDNSVFTEISLDDPVTRALFKEAYPDIRSVPVIFDNEGALVTHWQTSSTI